MIIRVEKTKAFTVICNTAINDKRLTWKAKGIHTYLMSKPDDWKPSIEELSKASKDSHDAVRAGLQELEKAGYMQRKRLHGVGGKIIGWEHLVYETPQTITKKPDVEKPQQEKPQLDFPHEGEPHVGNPALINTELLNTELPSTESNGASVDGAAIVPAENGDEPGARPVAGKNDYSGDFLLFWSKYPRKKEKLAAWKCWCARMKDKERPATPEEMIIAAERYGKECKGKDLDFIKHPATFLGPNKPFLDYLGGGDDGGGGKEPFGAPNRKDGGQQRPSRARNAGEQ